MINNKQTLIDFTTAWDNAMIKNDVSEIGNYMSDDWVCVGNNGITSKDTFLSWIESGDLIHTRMDSDEMHVKLYGNTGIITSKGTSAGTYKNEYFELYEWSASVYLFTTNGWTCVHTILTVAQK